MVLDRDVCVSSPRDKMTSPRLSSMDGFRAPRSKIDSLLLRPSLHDGETQKWFGGKEFDERASKRPPLSVGGFKRNCFGRHRYISNG